MTTKAISPESIVGDVVNQYPQTMAVFHRYGVDMCCGGYQQIAVGAREAGADLNSLVEDLEAAIRLAK